VCAFAVIAKEPKADTAHLGTWKQVALVVDGKEQPIRAATLIRVEKDQWIISVDGKDVQKGTTKADRAKPVATSEVKVSEGYLAGQTLKQISKIEGDVMIACIGVEEPKEFKSKSGSGHTLSVWIRVK
jgi:uncharacterized protein (TIGR03067 family)